MQNIEIVFYSVVLNHHQIPVADVLWEMSGHHYTFVELSDIKDSKGATSDYSARPYLLRCRESKTAYDKAMKLAKTADVCIFSGIESLVFEKERMKAGLLSFDMGERWLKHGLKNLLSPRLIRWLWAYYTGNWKNKPLYKLCCSAFCAGDQYRLGTFKGKCYKWGYFTNVDSNIHCIEAENETVSIMWCARFLKLKHPELPVMLAAELKRYGYKFILNMYGSGEEELSTRQLAENLHMGDCVIFHGNVSNSEVLEAMRASDIFLFTSDRHEGWGAVANESMSQGCALVASDAIGSTPYLIKDRETGCIFQSGDLQSLFSCVKWLLDNPDKMHTIQKNALMRMQDVWSPANAAKSLLRLINNLQNGRDTDIAEGPCSKAFPI